MSLGPVPRIWIIGSFGVNSLKKCPTFSKYTRQSQNINQQNYLEPLRACCSLVSLTLFIIKWKQHWPRVRINQWDIPYEKIQLAWRQRPCMSSDIHTQQTHKWISHCSSFWLNVSRQQKSGFNNRCSLHSTHHIMPGETRTAFYQPINVLFALFYHVVL